MMSLAQSGEVGRPDSSHLIHHSFNSGPRLSSNNPFRNRTSSSLPSSYIGDLISSLPERPISRNPFLDDSEIVSEPTRISVSSMMTTAQVSATSSSPVNGELAQIFNSLTTETKPDVINCHKERHTPEYVKNNTSAFCVTPHRENAPPRNSSTHRPLKLHEGNLLLQDNNYRALKQTSSQGSRNATESSNPPQISPEKKPRRNSDPSAMEHSRNSIDPDVEKRRQERKRRERKQREEKDSKPKKPNRKLDVIDKLDVTSIYGTGLFHHDGPFDACNPHRNRQGSKRAPMQAFPKDSLNNVLGGGGPINQRPDHSVFLGHKDEEAFNDYSRGGSNLGEVETYTNAFHSDHRRQDPDVLSATNRVEPIHGEETPGLGTSTFLEGAPASKNAMQRRASESLSAEANLPRSKSFAQKIRGINVPRRDVTSRANNSDGTSSPEARMSTMSRNEKTSIPIPEDLNKEENTSPVKKETSVTIVEPEKFTPRARTGSIPRFGLSLDIQGNNYTTGDNNSGRSGFLSRVKSLKGGSRKMKTSPIES